MNWKGMLGTKAAADRAEQGEPSRLAGFPLPRVLFDEEAYLRDNPDVAAVVAQGNTTAYRHYVECGYLEELAGRRQRTLPLQSTPLGLSANSPDALVERITNLELEKRVLLEFWDKQLPRINDIDFAMLSEEVDDDLVPPLDRVDCDESRLSEDQLHWRRHGFLIKENFFPEDLLDRYSAVRARVPDTGGWSCPVPYMHVSELRDVSLHRPLTLLLKELIGEEMGLHLNLTGWVSTDRNWHQDDYLNPPYINSWYAAVWIALDDIHPDCGPFEFVPGSHRWPLMRSHRVRLFLQEDERAQLGWPRLAERFVNDIAAGEIERRNALRRSSSLARVTCWSGTAA